MKRHWTAALLTCPRIGTITMLVTNMVMATIMMMTASSAFAAQPPGGRYTMTPTEGGFIRLDTHTGAVSICKNTGTTVVCELAKDSQTRSAKQIEDLEKENQTLRAEVERLEQHFGLGPEGAKPNDLNPPVPPSSTFKVPREEDVDQMFNYIEGMLKKFRERMRKLEQQSKPETQL